MIILAKETYSPQDMNELVHAMTGNWFDTTMWWHRPNRAFGLQTPFEFWQSGQDNAYKVIEYLIHNLENES